MQETKAEHCTAQHRMRRFNLHRLRLEVSGPIRQGWLAVWDKEDIQAGLQAMVLLHHARLQKGTGRKCVSETWCPLVWVYNKQLSSLTDLLQDGHTRPPCSTIVAGFTHIVMQPLLLLTHTTLENAPSTHATDNADPVAKIE